MVDTLPGNLNLYISCRALKNLDGIQPKTSP
jgi:hypothetical protein